MMKPIPLARLLGLALLLTSMSAAAENVDQDREMRADGRFSFKAVSGQFEIVGSDENRLRISGTLGDAVREMEIDGDAGHWQVELHYRENHRGRPGGAGTRLTIHLPQGAEAALQTVSGDLQIRGLDGARLEARSVSGDLSLTGNSPERLAAQTVSGSIAADTGGRAETRLQTVSGRIEASGLAHRARAKSVSGRITLSAEAIEELEAETVSGSIEAEARPLEGARFDLTSHSGSVRLALPSDTAADFRAKTFSGSIHNDFGGEVVSGRGPGERLEHRVGDGNVRVEAKSFSGSIRIARLN